MFRNNPALFFEHVLTFKSKDSGSKKRSRAESTDSDSGSLKVEAGPASTAAVAAAEAEPALGKFFKVEHRKCHCLTDVPTATGCRDREREGAGGAFWPERTHSCRGRQHETLQWIGFALAP